MGILGRLLGLHQRGEEGLPVAELARRLGVGISELTSMRPAYHSFTIPERSGEPRVIDAPEPALKQFQRRILRRLLAGLAVHPAVRGFQPGQSIVTNAACHTGREVVVRMDIRGFFPATSARRVDRYFRTIGWGAEAAGLLTRLCTYRHALPQGAPTSPRLSNLLNYHLDCRLDGLACKCGAAYTRYADDITFSFPQDDGPAVRGAIATVQRIVREEGYALHLDHKLHVRRRGDRQLVTGLVVNEKVNLPRRTRRLLRAVEHRVATGRQATLGPQQLAGWRSLQDMVIIQRQTNPSGGEQPLEQGSA